jgi:hypothetical protein
MGSGIVPGPATTSGWSRRAAIVSTAPETVGTTDASAIASTSASPNPSSRSSPSSSTSSSSVVPRAFVAARRVASKAPARNTPVVRFVLPMSRASSMAG